ncbi:hypothetical protein EFE32_12965 [Lactococcus lactis subsp. lactis]|uniref:hypothetical protein n=1 Tax=Lactococcus lactis TaxID=1358 RepID=UPI00223A756B|nr:hypothetical protein [Lactococcus lactis]MCT0017682.1 hypothetical protein [Lactococcus lactis subsp. lactis]
MKKLTKNQMIIGASVAILLIGGGTTLGVVTHNNSVHAQQVAQMKAQDAKIKADKKAKAEKLAKEKEAAQQKQVATLLASATANPSDSSIKAVNDAIAKLTDQKAKTKDTDLVKELNSRLALIKKAQAAVKDYQAHATDANKQKAAQAAITNLKDKNDQDVRAELQKLFDASNKQAQDAAKAAQAKQDTEQSSHQAQALQPQVQETQNNPAGQNETQSVSQAQDQAPTYSAPSSDGNTGNGYTAPSYNAPAPQTPAPSQPSGNTNTGGTIPSHPGGYGSIEDANKAEEDASKAGAGGSVNNAW